jgi:hypothetical protein
MINKRIDDLRCDLADEVEILLPDDGPGEALAGALAGIFTHLAANRRILSQVKDGRSGFARIILCHAQAGFAVRHRFR